MLDTGYKFGEVHNLVSQVVNGVDKVDFQNIFDNANGGVSLLAFRKGQSLATHLSPAEVMVYVLDGEIEFTMIDRKHIMRTGDFLLMGDGVPHSVVAGADSKVMLVKIKNSR